MDVTGLVAAGREVRPGRDGDMKARAAGAPVGCHQDARAQLQGQRGGCGRRHGVAAEEGHGDAFAQLLVDQHVDHAAAAQLAHHAPRGIVLCQQAAGTIDGALTRDPVCDVGIVGRAHDGGALQAELLAQNRHHFPIGEMTRQEQDRLALVIFRMLGRSEDDARVIAQRREFFEVRILCHHPAQIVPHRDADRVAFFVGFLRKRRQQIAPCGAVGRQQGKDIAAQKAAQPACGFQADHAKHRHQHKEACGFHAIAQLLQKSEAGLGHWVLR